jgi:hypothetical protein
MTDETETTELPADKLAYTITTFCTALEISRALYFKLQREGRGPRTVRFGAKVLITPPAAREWLERMERESA